MQTYQINVKVPIDLPINFTFQSRSQCLPQNHSVNVKFSSSSWNSIEKHNQRWEIYKNSLPLTYLIATNSSRRVWIFIQQIHENENINQQRFFCCLDFCAVFFSGWNFMLEPSQSVPLIRRHFGIIKKWSIVNKLWRERKNMGYFR